MFIPGRTINAEVGYEAKRPSGLGWIAAVGLTMGLAGCIDRCAKDQGGAHGPHIDFSTYAKDYVLPQARVAMGYWFF